MEPGEWWTVDYLERAIIETQTKLERLQRALAALREARAFQEDSSPKGIRAAEIDGDLAIAIPVDIDLDGR